MKRKINSKHIFADIRDARKFAEAIKEAGFRCAGYSEDGGLLYSNADGYTMYVAVQQKIRY